MTAAGALPQTRSASRQLRRAWLVVATSGIVFSIFVLLLLFAGIYIYRHATIAQPAKLDVVSGTGVLWRSGSDVEWRLVNGSIQVSEGDQISTTLGTFAVVTMFDGTTVEVAEDSIVLLEKMRVSRFTKRTKLVKIKPMSGTVYLDMVPRGEYLYSELVVEVANVSATMADGEGLREPGFFLVELIPTGNPGTELLDLQSVRVAVVQGNLNIETQVGTTPLGADQQITISPNGLASESTAAVREFVANGSFEFGLAGWNVIQEPVTEGSDGNGSIEIVRYSVVNAVDEAVQFSNLVVGEQVIKTGIEQEIGQTLRVFSDLTFSFEVKIIGDQFSVSDIENGNFPLTVELIYIDKNNNDNTLTRSYYSGMTTAADISHAVASPLGQNVWELVVFDLSNLRPLPAQITSIVLYASGGNFQTQVTNVSLTSSELTQDDN